MTKDTQPATWTPDDSQREVIEGHGGYHLVLAPPGCGKTQILTERIRLAHASGIAYTDMLCLTFTNRAARGMVERIHANIGNEDTSSLFVGNVHRFCSKFLFSNGLITASSSVIDEDDAVSILARCLNEDEYAVKANYQRRREYNEVFHLSNFMYQIRRRHPKQLRVHPECINHDDIAAMRKLCETQHRAFDADAMTDIYDHHDVYFDVAHSDALDYGGQQTARRLLRKMSLAKQYAEYKESNHLLDFNDLLMLTYDALANDTERLYPRYAWIQVDEVQDLNPLQMAIIDMATSDKMDTVMYLGDEQQAIFSFMGAKMDTLSLLRRRCEGAIHHLQVNHRSPKYLLDVLNEYAKQVLGIDASMLPTSTFEPVRQGNELHIIYSDTFESEIRDVAQFTGQLFKNYPNETTAIVVNSNRDAEDISSALHEQHLSHFKVSGNDIFSLPDMKLLLAHLGVLNNECNFIAWARILRGTGVFQENASARKMVRDLLDRAIMPSDLIRYKGKDTYVHDFRSTYDTREIVVFDTETTGLDVIHDDIIQIAAVKMRGGRQVEGSALSLFLQTEREIPAMLGDIVNPIIEERKRHTLLSPSVALRQFMEYVGDDILLGHNADYDYNILDYNLRRHCPDIDLHSRHPKYFDSLRLVRLLEPSLKEHKLKYLLDVLHLEGSNSHLADEDVDATCSVVRHCYKRATEMEDSQRQYLANRNVREHIKVLCENYGDVYLRARDRMYRHEPTAGGQPALTDELLLFHRHMLADGRIGEIEHLDYVIDYISNEMLRPDTEPSLEAQLSAHLMEMSTLKEADLCNSKRIADRIFVTTIHKAKGLEFDNVIVFDAVEGRMPSYLSRDDPRQTAEDARKFYVAISRAKRRLYISQCLIRIDTLRRQHDVHLTRFMTPLIPYFHTCRCDSLL